MKVTGERKWVSVRQAAKILDVTPAYLEEYVRDPRNQINHLVLPSTGQKLHGRAHVTISAADMQVLMDRNARTPLHKPMARLVERKRRYERKTTPAVPVPPPPPHSLKT